MTRTRTGTTTSASGRLPVRTTRAKIDYNEHKIADSVFKVPKAPVAKRTITKKTAKKKRTTRGPSYLALIKRLLKDKVKDDNHTGLSFYAVLQALAKKYPDRTDRRYVRLALMKGVQAKSLVQTRQSFRLSSKEKLRSAKKAATKKTTTKKTTKKTGDKKKKTTKETTKKTSGTKRKAPDAKTSTKKKSAAKEDANKKKKNVSKKSNSTKKPDAKKARTVSSEASSSSESVRGTIAEGAGNGVWQYYDNGWHNYEASGSAVVEGVYQEYKTNTNIDVRAVQSGYFKYQVDFTNLTQTNIQTGTVRNIQRVLEN